jgi:hypothetical protein
MSFWDSTTQKIIAFPTKPYGKRGWFRVDCGCCNGLEWGGEEPRECNNCAGTGEYAWHKKSGVLATYPGGPLLGRLPKGEIV